MMKSMVQKTEDEQIIDLITHQPGILDLQRAEIDKMVRQMQGMWWAPGEYVRFRCDRVSEELRAASAVWRTLPDGPARDNELRNVQAEHYRIQRDAITSFAKLLERVQQGPAGSKQFAAECQREMDEHQFRLDMARSPSAPPPFDARGFVTGLASRGVVMVADEDGNLTAMPASKLTEQDRTAIMMHKPAVRDAVQALTATF